MIPTTDVGGTEFSDTCMSLSSDGYRLMNEFAEEPSGSSPGLVCALFRKGGDVLAVRYAPDGDAIQLSDGIPSVGPYERLMAEMSGLSFGRRMDPIVYFRRCSGHPLQKDGFDASGSTRVPIPDNSTTGDDVFEIPVGPVHAGIIEPGHFRFSVAGEPVIELNPRLGYTHRGIEKLMETPASQDNSRLSERISGDTAVANSIAYAEVMEDGTEIPRRAKVIRTMLAELERLYNHIGSIAGICTDTAFTVPSAMGSGMQEKILRMNRELTGHRMLMNVVVPGGIRRDIPDDRLEDLDSFLLNLKFEIEDLTRLMMDKPALLDRMENTGVLSHGKAVDIGAVGPIARASGIHSDVRAERPYECYGELGMNTVTAESGDVHARTLVRIGEANESISLVHQCIAILEPGECRVPVSPRDGLHVAVVEAPRGELVHAADIRGGMVWRYSVRDPSFPNWFGMCHAVPGNVVPDFPLINKSFGLSYSGNDL